MKSKSLTQEKGWHGETLFTTQLLRLILSSDYRLCGYLCVPSMSTSVSFGFFRYSSFLQKHVSFELAILKSPLCKCMYMVPCDQLVFHLVCISASSLEFLGPAPDPP